MLQPTHLWPRNTKVDMNTHNSTLFHKEKCTYGHIYQCGTIKLLLKIIWVKHADVNYSQFFPDVVSEEIY